MIVETSALVAVLREEPESDAFLTLLHAADTLRLSAASLFEAAIVVEGNRAQLVTGDLEDLVREVGIIIEPVTADQVQIARQAYRDYGRGSGHPAALNFGDCFAYALAKATNEPLLFKGADFAQTDVQAAV